MKPTEPSDVAIPASSVKLPLIAMGLVNSALAMLFNELGIRFFEMAFAEKHGGRSTYVGVDTSETKTVSEEANPSTVPTADIPNTTASEVTSIPAALTVTVKAECEESGEPVSADRMPIYANPPPTDPTELDFMNFSTAPESSSQSSSGLSHVTTLTYLKRYSCDIGGCGKVFFSRSSLLHHRQSHLTVRNFACVHPGCTQCFQTEAALREHLVLHQNTYSVGPCKCTYPGCTKVFSYHDRLIEHFRIHTGERPYVCDYPGCLYRFARRSNLFAHKRVHIEKNKRRQYHCSHPGCGKTFLYTRSLTEHMNIHIGERPYRCEFPGCDKSFTSKSYLHAHRRVHLNPNPGNSNSFDSSSSYNMMPFPVAVTVPVPDQQSPNILPFPQTSQPSNIITNVPLYHSFFSTQPPP